MEKLKWSVEIVDEHGDRYTEQVLARNAMDAEAEARARFTRDLSRRYYRVTSVKECK